MTGEDNTKVCNNKTLLGTCMLVYIVCMLSGSDVLGMEKKIYLKADDLIQQIENDPTMYQDFKNILTSDERFDIKYKKRCRCCDTGKIDFKGTTMSSQEDCNKYSMSLEWYIDRRVYYDEAHNNIELEQLYFFKKCTNLDDFIINNLKESKLKIL